MNRNFIVGVVLCLALLVSGCAGGMWRALVEERGAEVSDEALQVALFTMCNAAPVGAINRYFNTDDLRSALDTICAKRAGAVRTAAR